MKFNIYEVNGRTKNLVEKNVSFGRVKERCITLFKMYRKDNISEGDVKSAKGWTSNMVYVRKLKLCDISKLQKIYIQNGEYFEECRKG